MRAAMASADVGDDVYGEDPTVRALEARTAALLGKEAALFVPSGTMGNQISLLCHTQRGDEVIIGEGAHCAFYESGAMAAWSGAQPIVAGKGGLFDADDVEAVVKPSQYYHPRTSLVAIENTHNRAGGRVFPQRQVMAIAAVARAHGLALHLDGARIWNAAAATGASLAELCAPFDSVSVCFSKGLGAPVGSAVAGSSSLIRSAHRFRKMLGGGMRQAGVLAAAALFALEHNLPRIAEDHAAARALGEALAVVPGVTVHPVETNIVQFETPGAAETLMAAAARRGVLVGATGPRRIRAVTHLDIPAGGVSRAASALVEAIREASEA
jgi:threonine aldolase